MNKILFFLLYVFTFFPYLKIIPLPTDTQPYALIISMIIVFFYLLKNKKIHYKFFITLLFVFLAFLVFLIDINMTSLRSMAGYLSLFFIQYAFYLLIKREKGIRKNFIKISMNIWFIVGFIQSYIKKDFLSFLIADMRTTSNRGVTSLAPEPTFYAIVILFFIIIISIFFEGKEKNYYTINGLIQIILFSKSTMILLFVLIYFALKIITKLKIKYVIYFVLIMLVIFSALNIYSEYFENIRYYQMFKLILKNPFNFFLIDASSNDRFAHIFFSIKGFVDNNFLPNGFSSWSEYLTKELIYYGDIFFFVSKGRIMSGFGSIIYEMGFIGLLFIMYLNKNIYSFFKKNSDKIFYIAFINLLMLTAIPIAFPIFNFLMASFYFKYDFFERSSF